MKRILAVLMIAATLPAHSAAPAAPNITVDDAVLQVNLEVMQWDAWRRECSEVLPEYSVGIGTIYVTWLDANRPAVLAMLAYAEHSKKPNVAYSVLTPGIGGGVLEDASSKSGMAPRDQCAATFKKLKAGEFAIARSYPDMMPVLARYLAAHPLSAAAARAYDNPLGCMKAALSNKVEFEQAVPMCRCSWQAMNSTFTAAEWKEYEAAAASKSEDAAQSLPQWKRALPKLTACAQASH